MKGLFITFEGIDGCGKSTQTKMLQKFLEDSGRTCLMVREPGGTSIGEKIRTLLLDKKTGFMAPMTELFLFEAARAQIVEEVIRPALQDGKVIICDRFYDSSTAYQGCARGLGVDMVTNLNNYATSSLAPDVTFFLDISVADAALRRDSRGEEKDRIELAGDSFQEKVRQGFILAAKNDSRIVTIDATMNPDAIHEQIRERLAEYL